MKILVINAGSSSLKYQVIDMDNEGVYHKVENDDEPINSQEFFFQEAYDALKR